MLSQLASLIDSLEKAPAFKELSDFSLPIEKIFLSEIRLHRHRISRASL